MSVNQNLRNLYLFHLLNGIVLTVVANLIFLDRLFLRMGQNMSPFDLVKGSVG